MKLRALMGVVILTLLIVACSNAGDSRPPADSALLLLSDSSYASSQGEWLTYGHDYGEQSFSPLSEINAANVSRLAPAYVFHTGIIGAFETSPVVDGGVMYFTTAYDGVFAVDAKTGTLRWKRDPLRGTFQQCCGPVNRGVAISKNFVLLGQLDGKVVALDRKTGAARWSTRIADNARGYSITMAPLVYRDLVIVGVGGGDLGIRGSLSALSLRTGKVRWRWFATDPQHWFGPSLRLRSDNNYLQGAAARARRKFANSWMRGGGGIWTTPAIDPSRDTIYLTTGNPWPDLDGNTRPGDNLFTDCIVALNASTGRMRWYFQEVPHDTMDLDAASPPMLFNTVDALGQRVDALGEIGKTGRFYVLDRNSGKLIRQSKDISSIKMPGHGREHAWTGGASWSPMSFDPALGYVIVTTTRHLTPEPGKHLSGLRELEHEWQIIYSSVSAINAATGNIAWQDEFDGGLVGGTVSTAGGITFVGEGNGYFDALDTRSGERIWRFLTGAGVNAPPIIFRANGHEYVAVASGGNQQLETRRGDALFTFGLAGQI